MQIRTFAGRGCKINVFDEVHWIQITTPGLKVLESFSPITNLCTKTDLTFIVLWLRFASFWFKNGLRSIDLEQIFIALLKTTICRRNEKHETKFNSYNSTNICSLFLQHWTNGFLKNKFWLESNYVTALVLLICKLKLNFEEMFLATVNWFCPKLCYKSKWNQLTWNHFNCCYFSGPIL